MATRSDLKRLAHLRLRESEALYDAKLFDGCVYTAGYVVELALKARICKFLAQTDYLDKGGDVIRCYHTHDLERLRLLAGLGFDLSTVHPDLLMNWLSVARWKPEQRYEPPGTVTQEDALAALDAIRGKPYGVLTWISKRW